MIPFWVRWVEVAQFPDGDDADDLQQWLVEQGIRTRMRPLHRERPGVGTTVGFQLLPDQPPIAYLHSVEVRRHDLDRAHRALQASGWQTHDYVAHWWLTQSVVIGGFALSAVIVVGLVVAFFAWAPNP